MEINKLKLINQHNENSRNPKTRKKVI